MENTSVERRQLTPELVLRAYAAGIFPMAESADDPTVFWVDPKVRGVLPLETFHVPRKLRRIIRKRPFDVRFNTAFGTVMNRCAETGNNRKETWINKEIIDVYVALHERGFAHSVECWRDATLVGGLYGVSLGAAFFGESMFSGEANASKVALVHLVAVLVAGGYRLLDTQFVTDHLRQFGGVEIPARVYLQRLEAAIKHQGVFLSDPDPVDLEDCLARVLDNDIVNVIS